MQYDSKACLYDILKACDLIISYTKDADGSGYLQDRRLNNSKKNVKNYLNSVVFDSGATAHILPHTQRNQPPVPAV